PWTSYDTEQANPADAAKDPRSAQAAAARAVGAGEDSAIAATAQAADSEVLTMPDWSVAPYFIVDDVVATANYYRDKLGFGYERFWNDPPSFCMVRRSGVVIMLAQLEQPGVIRPNHSVDPEGGAWDAYIWVDDADA